MIDRKAEQLGMHHSTASNRLIKDILFSQIEQSNTMCYRCGEPMTRDTFSIEHKVAWLDTEDPIGMFFDLDNVSYSHLKCNRKAAKIAITHTEWHANGKKGRHPSKKIHDGKRVYDKEKRRQQYLRTGK